MHLKGLIVGLPVEEDRQKYFIYFLSAKLIGQKFSFKLCKLFHMSLRPRLESFCRWTKRWCHQVTPKLDFGGLSHYLSPYLARSKFL